MFKKMSLVFSVLVLFGTILTPTDNDKSDKDSSQTNTNLVQDSNIDSTVELNRLEKINIVETKQEQEIETISFDIITKNDPTIEKGRTVTSIKGSNGSKIINYEVRYEDGKEIDRKIISQEITLQPVNSLVLIGTKEIQQQAPTYLAPGASQQPAGNCDPNYTGGCVPNVSYDLNCPDIGFMVRVVGTDRHGFDRDKDGYGCESYSN